MRLYRPLTLSAFAVLAIVLTALHSPGQMSVDSVMAVYEAATGAAAGWGPTFMAATISWLGGGVVGTSLFVAANCAVTYACLGALLTRRGKPSVPVWQTAVALLLALNPLFMFYVGIVWKDVMLTTMSMGAATLLLLASETRSRGRWLLLALAVVVTGVLVPIRQQGILIALPFAVVVGLVAAHALKPNVPTRLTALLACVGLVLGCSVIFYRLSAATVKPAPHGPIAVGIYTIQAYDIAGMIADAKSGDQSKWSGASNTVRSEIKTNYSSERIDTIWHLDAVREYFNTLSASQYMTVWLHGIEHSPATYLRSRTGAFAALLGLHRIAGCVPAYWGVAGLPDQVAALGLRNEMDGRAHVIGRTAQHLYDTPIFRNWFYTLLLFAGTILTVVRVRGSARTPPVGVAVAGWLYWLSFLPTTIACDVRYLYPVAGMATVLCVFTLTGAPLAARITTEDGDRD